MLLNRRLLCQTLLTCAALSPQTLLHAQTMRGGLPTGTGGVHGMHEMGPMMGPPGPGMNHHGMAFLHGLDLDDAQGDQIFMIMHEQEPQLRALQKSRMRAERELENLARSGLYSDAAAKPMVDAISKSTADAAYLHARAQSRIVGLLRPDQRTQIGRPGTRSLIRPAPDNVAPR